jgi:hypothetical protein
MFLSAVAWGPGSLFNESMIITSYLIVEGEAFEMAFSFDTLNLEKK